MASDDRSKEGEPRGSAQQGDGTEQGREQQASQEATDDGGQQEGSAESGAEGSSKGSSGGGRRGGPKGLQLINEARRVFASATGRVPESVTGLRREDDGWTVSMDVVELTRIPSSTDVMGEYLVHLSGDGEFLGYERVSRYIRSQPSTREQG